MYKLFLGGAFLEVLRYSGSTSYVICFCWEVVGKGVGAIRLLDSQCVIRCFRQCMNKHLNRSRIFSDAPEDVWSRS